MNVSSRADWPLDWHFCLSRVEVPCQGMSQTSNKHTSVCGTHTEVRDTINSGLTRVCCYTRDKTEKWLKKWNIMLNALQLFLYISGTSLQSKRVWLRLWVYLMGLYLGCLRKNWIDFHYKETKNKQVVCQRCAGKHVAMRHAHAQCYVFMSRDQMTGDTGTNRSTLLLENHYAVSCTYTFIYIWGY